MRRRMRRRLLLHLPPVPARRLHRCLRRRLHRRCRHLADLPYVT
jgi:hypothetical protein